MIRSKIVFLRMKEICACLIQKLVYPTARVYYIMSGISRCVALVVRVAQGSCQAGDQVCCPKEGGARGARGAHYAGTQDATHRQLSWAVSPDPALPCPLSLWLKNPSEEAKDPNQKGCPLALVESLTLPTYTSASSPPYNKLDTISKYFRINSLHYMKESARFLLEIFEISNVSVGL